MLCWYFCEGAKNQAMPETLRVTKSKLKWVRSLHQKKEREAQQLFICEGPKLIHEALSAGWTPHMLLTTKSSTEDSGAQQGVDHSWSTKSPSQSPRGPEHRKMNMDCQGRDSGDQRSLDKLAMRRGHQRAPCLRQECPSPLKGVEHSWSTKRKR